MTHYLINDKYGFEFQPVTLEELRHLLRGVFRDWDTVLEERADGIYTDAGERLTIAAERYRHTVSGEFEDIYFTTEHPASSYGQPVGILARNGEAIDVSWWTRDPEPEPEDAGTVDIVLLQADTNTVTYRRHVRTAEQLLHAVSDCRAIARTLPVGSQSLICIGTEREDGGFNAQLATVAPGLAEARVEEPSIEETPDYLKRRVASLEEHLKAVIDDRDMLYEHVKDLRAAALRKDV